MKMRLKVIAAVGIIAILFIIGMKYLGAKKEEPKCDADLSFAVLSDIHDNTSNLKNAINDLHKINSKMDAFILNGDSVDQGIDEQYDDVKSVLSKSTSKLPEVIIKNMGNHEYYNYSIKEDTEDNVQERINKYLEFSGNDKIYHDTWVKGYHFISLGSDNNGVDKVNYTSGCVSDEQIQWLKEVIVEDYKEGRPIFIFLHQPIDMTFFTLNVEGVDKNDEIKEILLGYPEVVLFTSHTHKTPNNMEDESNQVVEVNTGSVNSNYVTDESNERGFKEDNGFSNGLYIEVKNNDVIIKARNFKNNKWIYTREIKSR